jgi:ATP-binding cassette subfamily C protein CydC
MTARHPLSRAIVAMRPDPWRTALAALTGTAALASAIALIGTSGWLISRAAQHPPVLYLMVAVIAVRTFGIGRGVLRYAERLTSHDVALRGVVALRTTLYARLAGADPAVAAGLRRGDLLARVGADVDAIGDVVVRSLLPFTTAALTSLLSVIAVGLLLPVAGPVLAIAVLVAGLGAPALAALAARRAIRDTGAARAELSGEVLALLEGLPELSVAGVVADRKAQIALSDKRFAVAQDRAARPAGWAATLSSAAMGLGLVGCLLAGIDAENHGRLSPVLLAVVTLIPLAVAEVVAGLPAAAVGLVRARAAAERIVALLDAPAARTGSGSGRRVAAAGSHRRPAVDASGRTPAIDGLDRQPVEAGLRAHLRAEALDCARPGRPLVLAGVQLDLTPGRRIAVVGPSGGGKSTLLATLAGLLPPAGGRITLDGTDLAEFDPDQLRQAMHLCADDAHVFTTTVRENLRVAAPGADDTDLRWALDRAGLTAWLSGLPSGLDTMIGDPSGPSAGRWPLSGGERRRLLLARAFLTGAGILLVDEPAEHLDPVTADALVAELFGAGSTVVVVTHRLSALAAADEVLVVDEGRIAARGTHRELLRVYPPYRGAWLAEQGSALPVV